MWGGDAAVAELVCFVAECTGDEGGRATRGEAREVVNGEMDVLIDQV